MAADRKLLQPARHPGSGLGRPLVGFLAATLLAGLAGCSGGELSPSETVQDFYRALGRRDVAAACDLVAYAGRPLAGDDITLCRSGFHAIGELTSAAELGELTQATVTQVSVEGDRATVRADQLTGVPTAYRQDLVLVRIGARWYLDSPL